MHDDLFKRFITADKMVYYIPADQFVQDVAIYTASMSGDGIAAKKLLEGETGWWFNAFETGWIHGRDINDLQ